MINNQSCPLLFACNNLDLIFRDFEANPSIFSTLMKYYLCHNINGP